MTVPLSRREFLHKTAIPFRGAGRLLVPVLLACAAMVALKSLSVLPWDRWANLGILLGVFVLGRGIEWLAGHVFRRLSDRGRAVCALFVAGLTALGLMACGGLAWHLFRTGQEIAAVMFVLFVCVTFAVKPLPLSPGRTASGFR